MYDLNMPSSTVVLLGKARSGKSIAALRLALNPYCNSVDEHRTLLIVPTAYVDYASRDLAELKSVYTNTLTNKITTISLISENTFITIENFDSFIFDTGAKLKDNKDSNEIILSMFEQPSSKIINLVKDLDYFNKNLLQLPLAKKKFVFATCDLAWKNYFPNNLIY